LSTKFTEGQELVLHVIESWLAGDRTDDCIVGPGTPRKDGYCGITFNRRWYAAHRYVLEATKGSAPEDKPHALHSCDNPVCCNPSHLRWGDHAENMQDVVDRGRCRGENHGKAKLNWKIVGEIRARYAAGGVTQKQLAAEYGVSVPTICHVVNNKRWVI
jgi:hypothetical protein